MLPVYRLEELTQGGKFNCMMTFEPRVSHKLSPFSSQDTWICPCLPICVRFNYYLFHFGAVVCFRSRSCYIYEVISTSKQEFPIEHISISVKRRAESPVHCKWPGEPIDLKPGLFIVSTVPFHALLETNSAFLQSKANTCPLS